MTPGPNFLLRAAGSRVSSAVFLPTVLVRLGAHRTALPIGDGRDPVCRNSEIGEEILGSISSPIAETQVVLFASALVTVALNRELDAGMRFQEVRIRGQDLLSVGANIRFIEIKIRIFDLLLEQLLLADFLGRGRRRRWGRRRDSDRDARRGRLRPSRAFSGDRVRRRIGRRYGRRTLGLHAADAGLEIELRGIL